MRNLTSAEEKILDKTLYLIGKTGTFNIPIRAIAKEADVNVSAINYYFRSKDEMLLLVKQFYIKNTIAAFSILDDDEYNDREKIILCANEMIEYTLKYPGILVILREAKSRQDSSEIDKKIVEVTNEMGFKLDRILSKYFGKEHLKYKKMAFLSGVIYLPLNIDINNFYETLIASKSERLKYIDYILQKLE